MFGRELTKSDRSDRSCGCASKKMYFKFQQQEILCNMTFKNAEGKKC